LVVLIGVALVTNGALDLYFWYREERSALTRLQHQKATAAAAEIAHFVNDTRRQLEWAIQPAPLLEPISNAARRADFSRLLRQAPAITDLYYADALGRQRIRVSRASLNVEGDLGDVSSEPWFVEARSGVPYFGAVHFSTESEPSIRMALLDQGS